MEPLATVRPKPMKEMSTGATKSRQQLWNEANRDRLYSYQKKYRESKAFKKQQEAKKWSRDGSTRYLSFTPDEMELLKQHMPDKHQYFDMFQEYHREQLTYAGIEENQAQYNLPKPLTHHSIGYHLRSMTNKMVELIQQRNR